jgi:hypothetical protein
VTEYRHVIVHIFIEDVALRGYQPLADLQDNWRGIIMQSPRGGQPELQYGR